ncbi:MAG: putative lipid II flippase FtsW [Christensenellales bacterium]
MDRVKVNQYSRVKTNKKSFWSSQSKSGWTLACLIVVLSLFGVIMVYSASYYYAQKHYNNEYFFLIKQVIGFVLGIVAMFAVSRLNYNKLQSIGLVALIVGYVLLALVFIPGLGVENYGAKRWIRLPGFTIQSSEIAKFCFVIFASSYLARHHKDIKNLKTILPVVAGGGLMCLLIILEPNMSITMCVGIVMLVMLFVGGISFKHIMMLAIPAMALVPVLIIIEPYRLLRLLAFIDPWASPKGEGYQLIQSFFAVGGGGLVGTGLFSSRQKYLFLPFAESDFIFSVIAEECGLLGCIAILACYLAVIVCGIKIAINSKNRFGCYLASGITSLIGVQTMLNVAVVTGLIPPTGLPLPFISAGSTSLVVFMSAIGVLLNIDKQSINSEIKFTLQEKLFSKLKQNRLHKKV